MSVVVAVSMPDSLYKRIEEAFKNRNGGKESIIFKKSPFIQELLNLGLNHISELNK